MKKKDVKNSFEKRGGEIKDVKSNMPGGGGNPYLRQARYFFPTFFRVVTFLMTILFQPR